MTPRMLALLSCALALGWTPIEGGVPAWARWASTGSANADVLESGPLPDALWWRPAERPPLSVDPLGVLSEAPAFAIEQEWAPLYADRSGARIERARRTLTARAATGWLRTAAVLETRALTATTPAGDWSLSAKRPAGERALIALGLEGERAALTAAAGVAEWHPGAALAGRVALAPGWLAEAYWSRWTIGGSIDVRWNDAHVLAAARWTEQRAGWRLAWSPSPALGATLEQRAMDGVPLAFHVPDRAGPETAWRSTRATVCWPAVGTVWELEGALGEGREGLRLWREGTSYALATGPERRANLAIHVAPGAWDVRAWTGRWRGEGRGAVALWPFDGLGGVAGSRRVAWSEASFEHAGLSVDRALGARGAHEGGLAIAWLAPRTSWESWLAPLFGLGRSDEISGETHLRDVLALGGRLATRIAIGGAVLRAEVVQWAPVMVRRASHGSRTPAAGISSGGDDSAGREAGAHGGTIVRLALEGPR